MEKTKKKILIVDDEKSLLQILTHILQKQGYDTDIAETGSRAIAKINGQCFDLALIDMKLPDIGGLELLKIIHARKPKMKKIIFTGVAPEPSDKVLKEGADAYLMKPFRMEELLQVLRDKLEAEEN